MERFQPVEQGQGAAVPTNLDIFRLKGQNLVAAQAAFGRFRTFAREIVAAYESLDRTVAVDAGRVTRLKELFDDVEEQRGQLLFSHACSELFLKITDDVAEKPDFQRRALDIFTGSVRLARDYHGRIEDFDRTTLKMMLASEEMAKTNVNLVRESADPPVWFDGNRLDWARLMISYSGMELAETQRVRAKGTGFILAANFAQGALPDWYLERAEEQPTCQKVLREMQEDADEISKANALRDRLARDVTYITNEGGAKANKSLARFITRSGDVVGEVTNMHELILKILMYNRIDLGFDDPREYERQAEAQGKTYIGDWQNLAMARVEEFGNVLRPEFVALYLERIFKEAGMRDVHDSLTDQDREFFAQYIASFDGASDFAAYRITRKNAFKAFNYDLRPFFSLLGADDLDYLLELSRDQVKHEDLLWEIADLVSTKASAADGNQKLFEDIKEFGKRWLVRNWATLAYSFFNRFGARRTDGGENEVEVEPFLPVEEAEEERVDFNLGNLAGWALLYTPTMTRNDTEDIGGTSLDDRGVLLQRYLGTRDIACTVKISSVIRTIDWTVVMPPEIEKRRGQKIINGEVFKKTKRGPVRLLYQIDRDKKKFVFFVHQKTDWLYGF